MEEDDIFANGQYFHDDGTPIDPEKVPIPLLCLTCKKFGETGEEYVLCTLTRADQEGSKHFQCASYRPD
jgi:hypothetical protein